MMKSLQVSGFALTLLPYLTWDSGINWHIDYILTSNYICMSSKVWVNQSVHTILSFGEYQILWYSVSILSLTYRFFRFHTQSRYIQRLIILLGSKVAFMRIRKVHDGRINLIRRSSCPQSDVEISSPLVLFLASSLIVTLQNPYYVPVPDAYNKG